MKYAVKLTKENIEALGKWRDSGAIGGRIYGYILSEYGNTKGMWDSVIPKEYELISWEQFQQEVMGITPKNITYQIY